MTAIRVPNRIGTSLIKAVRPPTEEVRDDGNDGLGSDGLPDAGDYRHVFRYDPAGNRLKKTIDLGNDGSIDQVTAYRYNARDQLLGEGPDLNADGLPDPATETTYAYDDNGNTLVRPMSAATPGR